MWFGEDIDRGLAGDIDKSPKSWDGYNRSQPSDRRAAGDTRVRAATGTKFMDRSWLVSERNDCCVTVSDARFGDNIRDPMQRPGS